MLEVMQLAADQDPQQAEPADTPTDDKAIIFEQAWHPSQVLHAVDVT